ncbi:MAG TPA: hypothetical protein VKG92_06685 [Flavobacteriales bacterium]|nr:hypothetical protein [Flavobacteriales bacterium]
MVGEAAGAVDGMGSDRIFATAPKVAGAFTPPLDLSTTFEKLPEDLSLLGKG